MVDDTADKVERKPYCKPEIVHEMDLETRAGSGIPNLIPLDPATNSDP